MAAAEGGPIDEQIAYYRAQAGEYDATSRPEGDPFASHAAGIRHAIQTLGPSGRVLEICRTRLGGPADRALLGG